jgi:hypothetical protein
VRESSNDGAKLINGNDERTCLRSDNSRCLM